MKKIIYLLIVSTMIYSCEKNNEKQNTKIEINDDIKGGSLDEFNTKSNNEKENSVYLEATDEMEKNGKNSSIKIVEENDDSSLSNNTNERLVFTLKKVNDNNNIKGTVSENCNRIKGKSWRCCGKVIIFWDGKMKSYIHTSSNRLQGFTGAMRIIFYDANNEPIYEVHTPSYGVNGESDRWDNWSSSVNDWVIQNSYFASAEGIHKSSNRTLYYIYDLGKQYLKQQGGSSGFEF